jgi:hypothetical protein
LEQYPIYAGIHLLSDLQKIADAKERIAELEQKNAGLVAQVVQLRKSLSECRHYANYSVGDSGALAVQLMTIREIANKALRLEPTQCLAERDAEIKAQAVEVVRDHYKNKFPTTEKFTAAWIVEGLEQYAKELRQAKGGE